MQKDAAAIERTAGFFRRGQVEGERPPQKNVAELEDNVQRALREDDTLPNSRAAQFPVSAARRQSCSRSCTPTLVREGVGQAADRARCAQALPQRLRLEFVFPGRCRILEEASCGHARFFPDGGGRELAIGGEHPVAAAVPEEVARAVRGGFAHAQQALGDRWQVHESCVPNLRPHARGG